MCVCVCANYLLSDRLPYNPTDWNQISIHWSFSVPHVVRQPVSGSLGQTLISLKDVLEQHTSVLGGKPCLIFIHGTKERFEHNFTPTVDNLLQTSSDLALQIQQQNIMCELKC